MHKRFLLLAVVAACLTLTACGGNPKTYKVTGTVTYKDQPVADANVSFMVDGASRPSTGKTDAQGKFTLMTYKPNDGAHPGTNKVTITKVEGLSAMSPEEMAKAMTSGGGMPPAPKQLIPPKYATDAGNLTADVGPGKPNTFEFKLVD